MFRDHQQQFMQRGRKRKPIETGLPGADSQTGLQRVAASASEKKKMTSFHLLGVKGLVHGFALC